MTPNTTGASADKQGDEDERALAKAARDGDRRAFAALYDRHVDAVFRYTFFRLRSVEDAEDVTSEVFHRALVAMPRYEPRRPFLAFLYRIARNVIVDRIRAARPRSDLDEARDRASDDAAPDERVLSAERTVAVRDAVQQLTPLQQEIVVLRFIEGRSTKEISAIVGKGEATVRGIQMRALHALRALVEKDL